MRRIIEKNPQAHIVLLDVHREYEQSFNEWSEVITPENMTLPFWLLNFEEIVEILVGSQVHRETDIEILRELIPVAKLRYMHNQRRDKTNVLRQRDGVESTNIGIDTPIPYRASDLVALLEENIGKLDLRGELAPYKRLKARVDPEHLSLIPLSMYFKDGRAKVELGLAKGRKTHDKRQAIAERDAERDVRREMSRRDRA